MYIQYMSKNVTIQYSNYSVVSFPHYSSSTVVLDSNYKYMYMYMYLYMYIYMYIQYMSIKVNIQYNNYSVVIFPVVLTVIGTCILVNSNILGPMPVWSFVMSSKLRCDDFICNILYSLMS